VVLVTDSSACLPPALFYHANVRVVPIRIILPNGTVKETAQSIDEIYRAMAAPGTVTSSPPTLADYLGAIEGDGFEEALVLTPATEFTCMHRVASMAASLSARPVEVVDTRTVAAAQCLVAAAALEAIAAGAGVAEAAETARDAARRTELVAALPELGSMPRTAEFAAKEPSGQRRGHPLLRFVDGVIVPLPEAESSGAELDVLEAAWSACGGPHADETVIFHGASEPLARELSSLLGGTAEIVSFSPALALQMGVGCVGAAWTKSS
jgi:fatty acid-binding protein DegV